MTNITSPLMSALCVRVMTYPWMWLFMKNPWQGAQCAIRLATDPKLKHVTGEYFNDCEIADSSPLGKDKELAHKLYQQTMQTLKKVTKLEIDKEEQEAEVTQPPPQSAEETKTTLSDPAPAPAAAPASTTSAEMSKEQ